jgi:hypothetical protein
MSNRIGANTLMGTMPAYDPAGRALPGIDIETAVVSFK